MENRESNGEQQVWQRVFAQDMAQPRNDLRERMAAVVELLSVYRHLLSVYTGKRREQLRRLYEGEQSNLARLKGISALSGGGGEVLKLWQPGKEPEKKLLIQCYHKTRRCMVEYMSHSAEPEFGMVFRTLADREGTHCAILAELLGSQ